MSTTPPLATSPDQTLPAPALRGRHWLLRGFDLHRWDVRTWDSRTLESTDLGRSQLGRTDLAQQSAADERAGVAELRHLPLACAQPVDRLARCRCHHVCVANRNRHRAAGCRLPCSLWQCAVVDLCA